MNSGLIGVHKKHAGCYMITTMCTQCGDSSKQLLVLLNKIPAIDTEDKLLTILILASDIRMSLSVLTRS